MTNRTSGPGSRQGRPCLVCRHPERRRIELAVAEGRTHNDVAAEFGLSRFALNRHWAHHVSDVRKAEFMGAPIELNKLAERAAKEDRSLIEYLGIMRSELMRLFMQARDDGKGFRSLAYSQVAIELPRKYWQGQPHPWRRERASRRE
jgi:hypothetical protein